MRLYVYVLEAKDLALKDCYVKLQVGKHKSKTRILRNSVNPIWNEEFVFRVDDIDDEIVVSVFHHDDDYGFFNGPGDLMGRTRIPICSIADEDNRTLPPSWFYLQSPKSGKVIKEDCGKILLTISLHGKDHETSANHIPVDNSNFDILESKELEGISKLTEDVSKAPSRKKPEGKQFVKAIASRIEKLFNKNDESRTTDDSDVSATVSDYEDCMEEHQSSCSFEEAIELMQSRETQQEMPDNLQGGILINLAYMVSPNELNKCLFAPNSQFKKELAELQETKDLDEGPWTWTHEEMPCLTRVVSYTNAPTKLVKAVRATEEQTYIRACGREYAVLANVSTPEVPYGKTFKVELLYKIFPGQKLSTGEGSSRLIVSWDINFLQSTMMRSMIEGGVRQGMKESFDEFANLLGQHFKMLDSTDLSDKDHMLATLETEHQSDWELGLMYFWNFTVFATIFMLLYVIVHILGCKSSRIRGLEFNGLDLPDSFGELITSGILIIQLERVYNMISHFVQAKLKRGSDHGVKAQGEGWILTVALIEGINLVSLDSAGFLDPYVVLTCNGKTKTSTVKLKTHDPQWNEILEFDAMEEPPSVLDLEVFDFDGPFDQAALLGHAEINFLKHTSTELADMWICLEGKLAQSSHSKLHLRIFLHNDNGVDTIKEYLTKMEKEVGKKLNLRSPHRNSTFQKLFSLPPEEFLISDFTCSLKRKFPLQGRLFLSSRIVGFYANFFGHKTKFFFLWEDIEDIQILPQSLSSVVSPSLVIVLRKDRGLDAKHGAKTLDEEGRLKFYFQAFVSFNVASRTIMALWRTRTLTPDQKPQIAEEQQDNQDERLTMVKDTGPILEVEVSKMSRVHTAELSMNIKSLLEMFDGGKLEHKIMEKSGCLNYATSTWEPVKPDVFERNLSYKFNRHVSSFGGEVACTQQKSPITDEEGWIVNEVMALHDVPFGDHFRVHLRYVIKKFANNACKCDVYLGITWLKSTEFHQRITRNITEKFNARLKHIFEVVEREILLTTRQDTLL